jgi:pSer/pThr/pTyr-binding forkhead associated (FHA) protein
MPTKGFDRFCLTCGRKQEEGALVCRYCGTKYDLALADPTTTRQVDEGDAASGQNDPFLQGLTAPAQGIALHMAGSSDPFSLQTEKSFVIGRRGPEDTKGPLVDLSEYNGFAMGISRQHVMIRRSANGYDVIDLESRNGSWLDDQRLVPNRAYPIPGRAQLRLGMMRLFVIYRPMSDSQGQG